MELRYLFIVHYRDCLYIDHRFLPLIWANYVGVVSLQNCYDYQSCSVIYSLIFENKPLEKFITGDISEKKQEWQMTVYIYTDPLL